MTNIRGIFPLEIDGKERDLKCNFEAVEKLERQIYRRPIMSVLSDAINGMVYFGDIVDTIMVGLECNKDTRFKRDEVADEVQSKGMSNYLEWYMKFLTYAITGEEEPKAERVTEDDKKK